ncbi:Bardet-Biedl syndrome 7 protein homolog [Bicyclus anynana]|uniref:Bardet-Biedl syndrome 7 protein homolog n=1 Tax=Bicyclus anynana TaxID=110368 RepID=A0ABM3LGS0_BICAN|nr:Bardet-Biedl syndrome 7 protein homolog [Bicyclus anynana]
MDYDLARIDYTLCGITYPDSLKILPATEHKSQQKFVVGDKNGVLQCLSIKDEEPLVQFKTLPGKSITSVQLASSSGNNAEKIFAASGNEVKGYTRKGKVFLSIETSVAETITSMCVFGSDLVLCSGRTVTFYRELQEIYCYMCDDRVLDAVAFTTPNNIKVRLLVLIANKEAIIIENGSLYKRTYIAAGPTRITVPSCLHATEICVFYGGADGSIGVIFYEESILSSKCLVEGCCLGSVMCVGWFNNSSGTHLAVGRHDGSIQLYLINTENLKEKPRLKFTYFCGEPVTSVYGGCIGTEEPELLATTFSGRIFGLRSRRLVSGNVPTSNTKTVDAFVTRRSKLENEVARLEKQVANERDKYQRNTRSIYPGISAPPLLDIQYELSGATSNSWQEVKIISAVALDMLFIYCENKLDLQTDSAAVLSLCSAQEATHPELLATVRCQAGTRRLWLRMRTVSSAETQVEGTRVLIYVLPAGAPRVARLIKLHLPTLPHYSKYEPIEVEEKNSCWCELRVSGGFSVAEMTAWLSEALPGELPRPANNVAFARSHTILGTSLICRYQRGLAVFKSDNISTIAVLKDVISNCCVKRNIRADISCDIPDDYCIISFQNIKDKFKMEYDKNKDIEIKKAIRSLDLNEISINEETQKLLCKDYLQIFKKSDEDAETNFHDLIEAVKNWYLDWCKLSLNIQYNNDITILQNALKECLLEDITEILSKH